MNRFFRLTLVAVTALTVVAIINAYAATPPQKCQCPVVVAPLSEPNIQPVRLQNWVRDASVLSFQYNFTNIQQWMYDYSTYFSPRGWEHYYTALKSSGNVDKVMNERITATATPLDVPVIIWQGVDLGIYTWSVQIPLLVKYQRASGSTTQQKLLVTMMLRRNNIFKDKDGIGIEQFIAKPIAN